LKRIVVIGAGFAGLSAVSHLAQRGYDVTVVEQHTHAGGRARTFAADGFTFDMGPSWYWMPDVIEAYFQGFGKSTSDYYELKRLDPSYSVVWPSGETTSIPAQYEAFREMAEGWEKGSAKQLDKFLEGAAYKYKVGIGRLVYKPGKSIWEFMDAEFLSGLLRMQVFTSMAKHIREHFRDPRLIQLLEFPVLFLGALPSNTPALYSLMNHADIVGGTWYPIGGMHRIVEAQVHLATELGVKFQMGERVTGIETKNGKATHVKTESASYAADVVVAGADYHFVEETLLPTESRSYSEAYWKSRVLAPSSLIFYLGLDTEVPELTHHTLFFDADFQQHAEQIYAQPSWPSDPLFYVCAPSRTDDSVAPAGKENLFILIPVAVDLADEETTREHYYNVVMSRLEKRIGRELRSHVVYKRSYAHRDFQSDYNAYRGNAYGLANTLFQTALFKPKMRSRKVPNLFYTGQLTVPGPGVPPSLISGKVVAEQVAQNYPNH
jgi:phytoene desaturase